MDLLVTIPGADAADLDGALVELRFPEGQSFHAMGEVRIPAPADQDDAPMRV